MLTMSNAPQEVEHLLDLALEQNAHCPPLLCNNRSHSPVALQPQSPSQLLMARSLAAVLSGQF